MPIIDYSTDELWVIHEHVRQTRSAPDYGQEHSRDFVERLWAAILNPAPVTLSEFELVMITRQVSAQLMQGQRPIGREVLAKAFAALVAGEEPDVEPIPAVFERAEYADDNADDDADTGRRTNAALDPVGDLPSAG